MAQWKASWIGYQYDPRTDLGVFAFRNRLNLAKVPAQLPIKVSADNRYKLYVNGEMVAFGPQRGDAQHWHYDHFDLAPHLRAGENLLVALVWNFGWMAPKAQHTVRTGFVMEGEGIETPGAWEVARVEGWDFEMMHSEIEGFYIDIGPGEVIGPVLEHLTSPNPKLQIPNWRKPNVISRAEDRGTLGGGTQWMMIPRTLPAMRYEHRAARPKVCRGFIGDNRAPDLSLVGHQNSLDGPVGLPAGSKLLLDYGELLCAYPQLVLSGPAGSHVMVTYAEAMWQTDGHKGNRNEFAGKKMRGYQDKLILGSEPTLYEPLWWRTYRYLMIEVSEIGNRETRIGDLGAEIGNRESGSGNPVTVHSVDAIETGYPYEVQSKFEADDPWVSKIWDVSVRTAERCAGETYFDCPYYEQLQYAGDTRIQTLIGYYVGRDRRLQRNAVENLGWSMMENGLTQSRYPSRQTQVIPPFSLWWVMMLYDQMMYDGISENWVKCVASRAFDDIADTDPFWNFGDWVPSWRWGVPDGGSLNPMNVILSELCYKVGDSLFVKGDDSVLRTQDELRIRREGSVILEATSSRLRSKPALPSEHIEALYRIYEAFVGKTVDPWPTEALAKANAARCTYYFSYYKHLAMFGREDAPFDYLEELKPWKEMIENGLSTFAENPEPVRSDCHAWSAHPALGFFQIVAGVTSTAPAWKAARIAPKPGSLKRFDARIAHPDGELRVAYEGGKLTIDTPVPADLIWKGKTQRIKAGKHSA